jgi:hypothetical protein
MSVSLSKSNLGAPLYLISVAERHIDTALPVLRAQVRWI